MLCYMLVSKSFCILVIVMVMICNAAMHIACILPKLLAADAIRIVQSTVECHYTNAASTHVFRDPMYFPVIYC